MCLQAGIQSFFTYVLKKNSVKHLISHGNPLMVILRGPQEAKENQIIIRFISQCLFWPRVFCALCLIVKHLEGFFYSQVIWKLLSNSTKLIQCSRDTYSLILSQFYNMELSSHLEQKEVCGGQTKKANAEEWLANGEHNEKTDICAEWIKSETMNPKK